MEIDWQSLGFSYMPVKSNIRYKFSGGKWDDGILCSSDKIELSIASNCLHYGQAAFEGLKAFCCKDGKVRVFRPGENALRLNRTSAHIMGPEIPLEIFNEAVQRVVQDNIEYVPPYGTGGSLYIRPLLIGVTPQIGISASDDYIFLVLVSPVGPYYKGGIKPVDACVSEFDRAAPRGTGHIKIAGNYAASLYPTRKAKDMGCQVALFLDAAKREYIEEFGTSNFIGISHDGAYVTPDSSSILDSITNKSLRLIARDLGIEVERRPIKIEELSSFREVGACGTAVIITPVRNICHGEKIYRFRDEIGPVLKQLYDRMTGIQYGEVEDVHGWMQEIKLS
ncbi:MAG: branched-chain amino acid aminotransferase [Victivallales bacterium]|nr:branched-chain amino acid aminotransferase [Victivallales bacterium]